MRCSHHVRLPVLTLAAVFALQGCDDAPVAPDPNLGALGRDGGTVTVPMKIDATMTWVVPGASAGDCPDLIDPETGELFVAEGSGGGEGTHLGRFRITELDHPTINLCSLLEDPPVPPRPADVQRNGVFELVAADGNSVSGSYSFLSLPPDRGGYFTLVIEDGTGRFEGASGELNVNFEESGRPQSEDLLSLGKATLEPAVFEGEVTLPRP